MGPPPGAGASTSAPPGRSRRSLRAASCSGKSRLHAAHVLTRAAAPTQPQRVHLLLAGGAQAAVQGTSGMGLRRRGARLRVSTRSQSSAVPVSTPSSTRRATSSTSLLRRRCLRTGTSPSTSAAASARLVAQAMKRVFWSTPLTCARVTTACAPGCWAPRHPARLQQRASARAHQQAQCVGGQRGLQPYLVGWHPPGQAQEHGSRGTHGSQQRQERDADGIGAWGCLGVPQHVQSAACGIDDQAVQSCQHGCCSGEALASVAGIQPAPHSVCPTLPLSPRIQSMRSSTATEQAEQPRIQDAQQQLDR